jgi:AraC-type DNA-binding domain-containing proteins
MDNILYLKNKDNILLKYVKYNEGYSMKNKHFHNFYELYYLVKGKLNYLIEDKLYPVKSGMLVLIDKNQIHHTCYTEPESYHERILVQFPETITTNFFKDTEFNFPYFIKKYCGPMELNNTEQKMVMTLLSDMLNESEGKALGYQQIVRMRLNELLIFLQRKSDSSLSNSSLNVITPNTKNKMLEISSYILSHCDKLESLDSLASHFYLDKSYLSRKFKQTTGYTINEYLNLCRIKKAQTLLENSTDAISSIATQAGYQNISSFENNFKKYLGMTPLRYRNKLK